MELKNKQYKPHYKSKKGWGKKGQALRRDLQALKDAQYYYAPCPGRHPMPKFILTKLGHNFQKITNVKKIKRSDLGFSLC